MHHPFSARFRHFLECHFSWQAQYLVTLDGEVSFVTRINRKTDISWQA